MTQEDPCYNAQTVEDETMLLCLDLNGKGISNDEIAYGLWPVMAYFAEGIENRDDREGIAYLLEDLARDLRTESPQQRAPEEVKNIAVCRLRDQALQEGRTPE